MHLHPKLIDHDGIVILLFGCIALAPYIQPLLFEFIHTIPINNVRNNSGDTWVQILSLFSGIVIMISFCTLMLLWIISAFTLIFVPLRKTHTTIVALGLARGILSTDNEQQQQRQQQRQHNFLFIIRWGIILTLDGILYCWLNWLANRTDYAFLTAQQSISFINMTLSTILRILKFGFVYIVAIPFLVWSFINVAVRLVALRRHLTITLQEPRRRPTAIRQF